MASLCSTYSGYTDCGDNFCLHIKTIISSNIKGGGLKGNHRLLVQKFIELIRLLTLGGNLVTCIDCRYV